MHKEIFSQGQRRLLPFVKQFKKEYYLAGGTAIALYMGHRRSVDFDFFKLTQIRPDRILEKISALNLPHTVTRRVTEQFNVTVQDVKLTFYQYPFKIPANRNFEDILRLPELIDLSAMKAYALGRRSKWKDYVDMYFFLKDHFTVQQMSERASALYGELFSEKQFRAQLCYYDDIDFSEEVEFVGRSVKESEIKEFLTDKAVELF
jgi:Nucleotidyl transferase AbiEii toxin, Type IV TA system